MTGTSLLLLLLSLRTTARITILTPTIYTRQFDPFSPYNGPILSNPTLLQYHIPSRFPFPNHL